jgi:hypothetical protein
MRFLRARCVTTPVTIRTDAAVWTTNEKKQKSTASFVASPINAAALGFLAVIFCFFSLVVFAALGATPASAALPTEFGSEGEGPGQFGNAKGIAVDQESGDVYVTDVILNRVEKFTAEGTFLLAWGWGVVNGEEKFETCGPEGESETCQTGNGGEGAGQFDRPEKVAVDNSLGLSHGDVYVTERANNRVQRFSPAGEFELMFGGEVNVTEDHTSGATEEQKDVCTAVSGDVCGPGVEGQAPGQFEHPEVVAVGPAGTVYVGGENISGVLKFSEGGVGEGRMTLPGSGGGIVALAVSSGEDVYVADVEPGGVREYEGCAGTCSGVELGPPRDTSAARTSARIALGPLGELFISEGYNETMGHSLPSRRIFEYGSGGGEVASFNSSVTAPEDVAFGGGIGELYLLNRDTVRVEPLPPAGPIVESEEATPESAGRVTVRASIDPEGQQTKYHLDYGTDVSNETVTAAVTMAAKGFEPETVEVKLTGLEPETVYHFHLVAENSNGGPIEGEPETFTTDPALRIDSTSVTEVTSVSAVFGGLVDPLGEVASYRFEYLTEAAYQLNLAEGVEGFAGAARVPTEAQGDAPIASSEEDQNVSQLVEGLQPATTYRYRLLASNPTVPAGVPGPGEVFRTEGAGSGVALVDGRAWEMVSPPDKHGVGLEPFGIDKEGGLLQAAADGGAFAYIAKAPIDAEPAGNRSIVNQQLLARRGADGGTWTTQDIAPPHEVVAGPKAGELSEYKFFSADLSSALVTPEGSTPLSPYASERTPYLRNDNECEPTASEAIPATCYTPLVNPGNVVPGTKFGTLEIGGQPVPLTGVDFVGATPDLSHIILESHVQLTAAGNPGTGVYEWSGGQLQYLPFGAPSLVDHALSDDGSSFFSGGGHLFVHDFAKDEAFRLDLAQNVPEPAVGGAEFFYASSDGSRVLFNDSQQLTTAAGGGVYECRVVEDACGELVLTDLSPSGSLLGGSEDASYLYFVSGGSRVAGFNNTEYVTGGRLEVAHYENGAWTTTAGPVLTELSILDGHVNQAYRISPNGRFLAFMSQASLTGFDNRDAVSGVPDEEVYEYDAASNRLVCASCNPTGARPVGIFDHATEENNGHGREVFPPPLVDKAETWAYQSLAGSIPGLTWVSNENRGEAFDQPRYLDDSGRLYFDSPVGLVPGDANGKEDVYEYEPEGAGPEAARCGPASDSGVVVFKPAHTFAVGGVTGEEPAGCVGLISSGTSSEESVFLDASESGEDVFFMTAAKLAPQDVDNALDVYDAHVCSAASPCPAGAVSVPPACTTVDSCRAANPPQPTIFGAPPSATFNGAGNLTPAAKPPVKKVTKKAAKCPKGKVRNKKRRCVKKSKSKRSAKR